MLAEQLELASDLFRSDSGKPHRPVGFTEPGDLRSGGLYRAAGFGSNSAGIPGVIDGLNSGLNREL